MNKFLIFFITILLSSNIFSQTSVDVEVGAKYANEAYYSFSNGTVSTHDRMSWDISFPTNRYGISIMANNGANVELYTYPDGDISAWNTVDITNIGDWQQMYNSIVDWENGAFMQNQMATSQVDFGWGQYNMIDHNIVGDSLFIIKTTAGNYKKLWIINKNPNKGANTWEFKYANIDGSDEHSVSIQGNTYSDKNNISYSLETNKIIENEPASDAWELLFTKYYDTTIPYYVTGVLSNSARVKVQEVDAVSAATYEMYTESEFSDTISKIGSDWKSFNLVNKTYELDPDKVYFAKVMSPSGTDSSYWKMYFTNFSGSSDGKYSFIQKQLSSTVSIGNSVDNSFPLEIYPNPANDIINIVYDIDKEVSISIIDLCGRVVYNEFANAKGFEKQIINVSKLKSGVYYLVMENTNFRSQKKFIKL